MNHGSPLENWLRNIRDVWRLHYDEIVQFHGEARVRRLVELNVVEQCLNVYKTASVQKRRWETLQKDGKILPQIHGLVYDVANGELKKLPIDFSQSDMQKLQNCFDLYEFEGDNTLPD
uniref:Carbonic anhydrase n=2 Tax=Guillardia theta TaxID=55529 RepID=A0A7S4U6Z7_GUITH|mmetsp:Transcript_46019/g.144360  ORF Transcript_46019/g.144360 Transcript_46019/m.144360 type:complete len:118 (+) Transcript_46019:246-599(+)